VLLSALWVTHVQARTTVFDGEGRGVETGVGEGKGGD
jgi:hypothetical protein